jgi:dipeptidyl aminopeptidase/acylaminoacyl peptidase
MPRSQLFNIALSYLFLSFCVRSSLAEQDRRFSVRDDIELAKIRELQISPAKDLVLVHTERASLEDGNMHDTLRLYKMSSIREAVNGLEANLQVEPLWSFERVTKDPGGNSDRISRMKWLPDSNSFAFLLQVDADHHRLYLANIASKRVIPLSAARDDVLGFDIRDSSHYVYTTASHEAEAKLKALEEAPYRVGTGHSLEELAFPEDFSHFIQRGELWAAIGGRPKPVIDRGTGKRISFFSDGNESLGLSPDGSTLVTLQAVENISDDWVNRFPPPFPESANRLKAHHQDQTAAYDGWSYVSEWVRITLVDGTVTSLTNAPASQRAGWWQVYTSYPAWSDDGSSVLLPGSFSEAQSGRDVRPCILIARLKSNESECVRPLKRQLANGYEEGWESIDGIEFVHNSNKQIQMKHDNHDGGGETKTQYVRSASGKWSAMKSERESKLYDGLSIKIDETFNEPPVLVASDPVSARSRVIFDPNPQLKGIVLGESEPYRWHDRSGREWEGILYKPVGYSPNVKYPLVIQNHGFNLGRYLPSGGFPSAFVAQELASAGIMVLQVRDCAGRSTPLEGPCNVEGYESAVAQLSKDGLVDSSRVGIIGFSRTVFYVLEALAISSIHFKAASITDGITLGYMDYLQCVGLPSEFNDEKVGMIGSEPFGSGLAEWVKASPDFHLDKVATPLRVVATRGAGVVEMWEPYALLEAMHKPVDLVILNTREHVLADPAMRLAAQSGNIDWFRFWLQGYEDPDSAKLEQYARWRRLRDGSATK